MSKKILYILALVLSFCAIKESRAQNFAVRGNALLLFTGTLNVGLSYDINRHWSVDVALMGNPIKTPTFSSRLAMVQPGMRYWLHESNYSHFFSAYLNLGAYDIILAKHSYVGATFGFGVSWGYYLPLSKRLNLGFEIGAGVLYARDKNYDMTVPDSKDLYIYTTNRVVFSPTKLEVSIVYLF